MTKSHQLDDSLCDDLFGAPDPNSIEFAAGVDEAGRGPLAGPVYAAAVILDPARPIEGLRDSKKLTAERREELAALIKERALAWSIAFSSAEEIDRTDILRATLSAMTRAIEGLGVRPHCVLVDGNRAPAYRAAPVVTIVKGDDRVQCISAASILAKTAHDAVFDEYEQLYPGYGFAHHKGYGTREHVEAIREKGVLPVHRKTFEPIRSMLADKAGG